MLSVSLQAVAREDKQYRTMHRQTAKKFYKNTKKKFNPPKRQQKSKLNRG